MTSTPVLSYKKPSQSKDPVSSPIPSSASMSPKVSGVPTFELPRSSADSQGTRKVSSRRKALQEFYHIQQQKKAEEEQRKAEGLEAHDKNDGLENKPTEGSGHNRPRNESISGKVNVDDPVLFANYIRNTPIQEILQLRNSITNNLNSHDSEKKSIIYDNYYELIKLNQTLQNLSNPTAAPIAEEGFTGLKGLDKPDTKVDRSYIFDSLNELKDFFENRASLYNDDFQKVIGKFDMQGDTESISSVKGVINELDSALSFPDNIDKVKLISDIDGLLSNNHSTANKSEIKEQLSSMIQKLDKEKDELLILQLQAITSAM